MPLELIADSPGHAVLQPYELDPLKVHDVRIRCDFSSTKHGTEMRGFRADSADATDGWDGEYRLHMRGRNAVPRAFPMPLGERFVGRIIEIGDDVDGVCVGDRVVGLSGIREIQTLPAARVEVVPDTIPVENLVYDEAAMYALGAVRDAPVRLGDRVAIFGLGALGLMAVQLACLAGASWIVASDPIEHRRRAAEAAVDELLDPGGSDVGLEIKKMTDKLGVDVSIETSASYHALYDALRATRFQGTVVSIAYYTGEARGLILSGEWHRNQLTVISSRGAKVSPRHFSWDDRLRRTTLRLLHEQRLDCRGLVDPVVPMSRAAEAYMQCNEHPENSIKLGIDHTLEG